MKNARIAFVSLLAAIILAMSFQIKSYQITLSEKAAKIEMLREQLANLELSNQQKDGYIKELHISIESLTTDLTMLEEKLHELEKITNKLD